MGRHNALLADRIGARLWTRFLKTHLASADLRALDRQLSLPVSPGERFVFGKSPTPSTTRNFPKFFESVHIEGRNPDGRYALEPDDAQVRFNLFERVDARVPQASPWLLRELKPHLTDQLPTLLHSATQLWTVLAELDCELLDAGPISGWLETAPNELELAERTTLDALTHAALPQSLSLLFALLHVKVWLEHRTGLQRESMLHIACHEAVSRFGVALRERQFDDADEIAATLRPVLHQAVGNVAGWGSRCMPDIDLTALPRMTSHIVIVPRAQPFAEAAACLHRTGMHFFETLLDPVPAHYAEVEGNLRDGSFLEAVETLLEGVRTFARQLSNQCKQLFPASTHPMPERL